MTTIAMAAGMFPSALGFGDGGGFRSPMAIAVIGGLIMSTLLSLVFVPAVFTVMDDHRAHLVAPVQPPRRPEGRASRLRAAEPGAIAEDAAGEDHSGAGGVGGLLSPPDEASGRPR